MPKLSIVIPARNVVDSLPACLASLAAQSFQDFEAVVVDDSSKDGTLYAAQNIAKRDARLSVVAHPHSKGLHLARMTGVEAARGEYLLFLDAGTELPRDALAGLVAAMEQSGCDVLHLAGEPARPDWDVTRRLYRTAFARRAFASMSKARLDQIADAYEAFVLACTGHVDAWDGGAGASLPDPRDAADAGALDPRAFDQLCADFSACVALAQDWAASWGGASSDAPLRALLEHCAQTAADAWLARLADADKAAGAGALAQAFGDAQAASQLYRVVAQLAQGALASNSALEPREAAGGWAAYADELAARAGEAAERDAGLVRNRRRAEKALEALEVRAGLARYADQDVRIFVSTHKEVDTFEGDVLQPVQVGSAKARVRFANCLQDDDGENISQLNASYCELTTQYWAWKNVDAPYVGFCHYRRYFDFSDTRHEENEFGEVMDGRICREAQERYGLTDEAIHAAVEGFDVVTTEVKNLKSFPGHTPTPYKQYAAAPRLHIADLERVCQIVKQDHPDYAQDVDAFLSGNESCFCNMFVMRREVFDEYCSWLFPILEKFCEATDMSHYSREALRTPGHLAERLLNIFLAHAERTGRGWKRKQVQCVHFTDPEPLPALEPPEPPEPWRPTVPVVFAADDNYVPMLTATVHSMLSHASDGFFYDVTVLQNGISADHRRVMREFLERGGKARVRFVEAGHLVDKYGLSTNNAHIGVETYYRFLIQDIMPWYDKVIYLDSDLIVEGDVSQLWKVDLGENLLAAARDIDFLGNLNSPEGDHRKYNDDVLHMSDPYRYFQAGVLVLNTAQMRRLHTMDEWLRLAGNDKLIYNDQDVLNAACEGRVTYLDWDWNVMHDCGGRVADVFAFAPADAYAGYLASRAKPKVVHYAGLEKPWKYPGCDFAEAFWRSARQTPFYETLLAGLSGAGSTCAPKIPQKALGAKNPLRKVLDPLFPLGSRRREALKRVGRKLRGRD